MTPDHDSDLVAIEQLSGCLSAVLQSIQNHQWSHPTPCVDWDVRALVDHVVGGNWFTAAILDGETAEGAVALAIEKFGGSVTVEQAASSVGEQLDAFAKPGVLDRTWSHVAGDLTGRQILRLRLHDLIVHTWDLQQALGTNAVIPPDLIGWGLAELAAGDSLTAKHFELDDAARPAQTGDLEQRYLSSFGR